MIDGRRRALLVIGTLILWLASLYGMYALGSAVGQAKAEESVNLALCRDSLQRRQGLEKALSELGRQEGVSLAAIQEVDRLDKELTGVEADIARFCGRRVSPHERVRSTQNLDITPLPSSSGLKPFSPPSPP